MKKIVYYHGGPGLNSNPEKNLLTGSYADAGLDLKCWNEPSAQRPDGPPFMAENAFSNYLKTAEDFFLEQYEGEKLVILCHSFGAFPAQHLSLHHEEKIEKIIFVSSGLSIKDADHNIFTFMKNDYKEHGDDKHKELEEVLKSYRGEFDENKARGFTAVAQNPRLFDYYWLDKDKMAQYLGYYIDEYALDVDAFFKTRASIFEIEMPQSSIPIVAVYGDRDIVISKDAELRKMNKYFKTVKTYEFAGSAHYPHIEEQERFLEIVSEELGT